MLGHWTFVKYWWDCSESEVMLYQGLAKCAYVGMSKYLNTIFLTFIFFQCQWAWKHRVDAQSRTTRSVAILVVELQDKLFGRFFSEMRVNGNFDIYWYGIMASWQKLGILKLGIFLLHKLSYELLLCFWMYFYHKYKKEMA